MSTLICMAFFWWGFSAFWVELHKPDNVNDSLAGLLCWKWGQR